MATFISNSVAETEELGRDLARKFSAGFVVALQGELGAGKTHFAKGVVAGLGGTASVTSPTFTIIHEYSGGRLPVYHFDFFRLKDRSELSSLGLDDYFFGEGVSIIEWADRFPEVIPENACWVTFEMKSKNARKIHVR